MKGDSKEKPVRQPPARGNNTPHGSQPRFRREKPVTAAWRDSVIVHHNADCLQKLKSEGRSHAAHIFYPSLEGYRFSKASTLPGESSGTAMSSYSVPSE